MKIIIIGAGPAGLMCATTARSMGADTIIIEKNEKPGKKLYITGKGRCNVTNQCDIQSFLSNVISNSKFMMSSLNNFDSYDTIDFVQDRGVPLKVERGNRVFPSSDKSSDIIKALLRDAGDIHYNETALEILVDQNKVVGVRTDVREYVADAVVIATGGLSYKATGSTGDGYKFASSLGHDIVPIRPGLVPMLSNDEWVKGIRGLSLKNVKATFVSNNLEITSEFGEMLFTDRGLSGPIILTMSSRVNNIKFVNAKVLIDLKPALDFEQLNARILRDFDEAKNKDFANSLKNLLPSSLIPIVVAQSGISAYRKVNSITKEEREKLISVLKGLIVNIKSLDDINFAIITAGGVDTKQINPKTMQSKIVDGLYFAGEVIDVDALTGGFNIQIALSTGKSAGEWAVRNYEK
ncbi:MAG: NAD(P)/FAD-dependent oxidoreductase [Clostridia bacterium]|nr:NAD(P)/FAD-dependent oxidoreductase [Clostridia bacterium]